VQAEEVGRRVDIAGAVGALHLHRVVELGRDERVVGDDLHVERLGAVRDELADAPEAEDAERLAAQLGAAEVLALPTAGGQRGVRLRDVARDREQQRHRVLGRRDDVRARRVDDDDAALRGGGDVDVVDPDAGARDGAQVRRAGEQVGVDLRRRADDDRVVGGDPLLELLARPVIAAVDVEAGDLEHVEAGVADVLGHEHAHLRGAVGGAAVRAGGGDGSHQAIPSTT
jgi:hypothetical protein